MLQGWMWTFFGCEGFPASKKKKKKDRKKKRKTPRRLPSSLTRRENQGRAFPMLHWDRSKYSLTLHIILLTDSMTLFTFKQAKNKNWNSSGFPYDMYFRAGMECRWVCIMCRWDPEPVTALKGRLTSLFRIKRRKLNDSAELFRKYACVLKSRRQSYIWFESKFL